MSSTVHLVDISIAPACRQCTLSRNTVIANFQSHVALFPARASLRRESWQDHKPCTWKPHSKSAQVARTQRVVPPFGGHTCIKCEQESLLEHDAIRLPTIPDRGYVNNLEEPHHAGVHNGSYNTPSLNAPLESGLEKEAWELLRDAVVSYCGEPVGTIAANDPTDPHPLNYDQVFIRDFIPSAVAFLLKGETEIVRNFLLHTLQLQV